MLRISRYLLLECGQAVGGTLLVLTFLLMLPQVLDLVDLWVNKNAPVAVLLDLILLMLPRILLVTLPMSLLLGILLAMGRMSDDSEIVVMKAAGMSLIQLARPIAPLALFFTLSSLWLTWQVVPESRQAFLSIKESLLTATILSLKPQTFNRPVAGLTLYIHEKEADGHTVKGIFIHDNRHPQQQITLTAREGTIYRKPGGHWAILLREGGQHQRLGDASLRQMTFATYDMDFGITLDPGQSRQPTRPELLNQQELALAMESDNDKQSYAARMEWHRRLAIPFATLVLGVAAIPLGVHHHRSGKGYSLLLAVLLLLFHMLLLTVGEGMAKRHTVDPAVGLWAPNLLMCGVAIHLLIRANQEKTPALALWLDRLLTVLPQRLLGSVTTRR